MLQYHSLQVSRHLKLPHLPQAPVSIQNAHLLSKAPNHQRLSSSAERSPKLPSISDLLARTSSPQLLCCPYHTCSKVFSTPQDMQLHMMAEHPVQSTLPSHSYTSIPALDAMSINSSSTLPDALPPNAALLPNQQMRDEPHSEIDAAELANLLLGSPPEQRHLPKAKPFKCPECASCFSSSSGLKQHSITHTKEKPFVCDICAKAYTTNNRLTIHKRAHTNQRPYVCEVAGCGYSATQKCSLQNHRLTHLPPDEKRSIKSSRKRTIMCSVCSKLYKTEKSLELHRRQQHH